MRHSLDTVARIAAIVACLVLVLGLRDTPSFPPARVVRAPHEVASGERLCADVVDARGRSVARARVRAFEERPGLAAATFVAVADFVTDARGRGCASSVPRGALWVLGEADAHARASTHVQFDGSKRVRLVLPGATTLAVRVTDELGAPLHRATVLVTASDPLPYGKLSDATGLARFGRLPPPAWALRVSAPGYEAASRTAVRADVTVALRRLSALDVRVIDANGRPAVGAAVVIAGPTLWPARKAETDAYGLAAIRGLAEGQYALRATRASEISEPLHGFELGRGAHESLTLKLVAGRHVTALVTDGTGEHAQPVASADVVLVEGGIGSFPLHGRSAADGRVTLGPISMGPATLAARAAGFIGGPLVSVPEVHDDRVAVRVTLVRGGTLRGEVVDAGGYPVAGAQIEVVGTDAFGLPIAETPLSSSFRAAHFDWALSGPRALVPAGELGVMPGPVPPIPRLGSLPTARESLTAPGVLAGVEFDAVPWVTGSNGEFVAKPVTPGRVRVIVRHPEYVEGASAAVALPASGEARTRIVLLKGGSVEGRVLDERGFPVAGVDVKLVAERGTFERSSVTAADGSFAFAAAPREATLSAARAEDPSRAVVRRALVVPEGGSLRVDIEVPAPRDSVRVLVADESGAPVELAEVRVQSLLADVPLRTTLFTDVSGTATLPDARGLPLRLVVDAPRFATLEQRVESAAAEIRVALDRGVVVSGRVTAVRGRKPAAGALVTLRAGSRRKSTMTDGEGAFRFAGIHAGTVELSVTHPEYAETKREVRVERTGRDDRPFELPQIDLTEPGEIHGEVLDAGGRPIEGARVAIGVVPAYLPQGATPAGIAVSDSGGAFVLRGVAPGTVTIEAYAAGVGRGTLLGIAVASGRETRGVTVRLSEPDQEPEPLASGGVAVTLEQRGPARELVVTHVASNSEAERGGLAAGDIIQRIDGAAPGSLAEARQRLAGRAGSDVVIEASRGQGLERLRLTREPVRR